MQLKSRMIFLRLITMGIFEKSTYPSAWAVLEMVSDGVTYHCPVDIDADTDPKAVELFQYLDQIEIDLTEVGAEGMAMKWVLKVWALPDSIKAYIESLPWTTESEIGE